MAGNINVNGQVNLKVNFQTEQAVQQMQKLTQELNKVSSLGHQVGASLYENIYGKDGKTLLHNGDLIKNQIQAASKSAMELQSHLITAFNPKNGNLDLMKFTNSLKVSGKDLNAYSESLMQLGSQGKQSYMGLARAVASAEMPLKRTTTMMDKAWGSLKRTAGWMVSSSILHGFIGNIQQAVGYAQDLNKSLTDIRIVTNASSSDMARFAKQANVAAKELNTTTTRYTKASLIYYQQGLNNQQVKERTETTIKMANVTGETAQKVSDQMTAIWNNYDNGTKSLTHYADVMTALGAATASSTTEIAEGLQKFASISNTVGLSYEYAASALATITSTSRESADVTGNSLKTLFSRIQGLQLGETLDDGTTLNKYSTALAKVGISIKDSSGELKSMDNILDEMGNTWQTLANDEKMALAQTVAGVRQYTQLMTLMENWDDFKRNLNIANNSEGTIDQQAMIFAESWEAASNKVRASWEGLWDSLINSDGFIGLQNGLSTILNFFELMVDGAGGLTGTLTMLGGLFGKMFTPQIASAATNMINGIQQLNPKTAQVAIAEREKFLKTISNTVNSGTGALMGMGAEEGKAFKQQITALANNSADRAKYLPLMNEQQRAYDNILSEQMKTIYDKKIQYGREKDILDQSIRSQAEKGFVALTKEEAQQYANIKTGISDANKIIEDINNKEKLNSGHLDPKDKEQKLSAEQRLKELTQQKEVFDKRGKVFTSLKYIPDQSVISSDQLNQLQLTANKGAGMYSHLNNAFWQNAQSVDGKNLPNYTGMQEAFTKALENQGWSSDQIKNSPLMKAMSNIINAEPGKEGSWAQNADLIRKEMKSVAQGSLNSEIDKMIAEGKLNKDSAIRLRSVGGKMFDSALMGELIGSNDTDLEATKEAQRHLYAQVEKTAKIQSAVGVAQGLSFAVSAAESIKSLNSALRDLASGAGNVGQVLTATTSTLLSATMGFSSLSNSLSSLLPKGAPSGLISAGIMAAIAAVNLAFEANDYFTTTAKELQQGLIKSNEELANSSEIAAQASELAITNNEEYLNGVKKINSLSQDPATLAEDIFESNKKALSLINDYNLSSDQYKINSQGLIEISKKVLAEGAEQKANIAENADLANILGNAQNDILFGRKQDEKVFGDTQTYFKDEWLTLSKLLSENNLRTEATPWTEMKDAYMQGDASWQKYKQDVNAKTGKDDINWEAIDKAMMDFFSLSNEERQATIKANSAAMVAANQILANYGINAGNEENYAAVQHNVANKIADQMGEELVSLEGTNLSEKAKSILPTLLEEQFSQKGAHNFKLSDGVLSYRLDGEDKDRTIQAATINSHYNVSEISKQSQQIIDAARESVQVAGNNATAFIKEFGSVTSASAESVYELYQDKNKFKEAYGAGNEEIAQKEYEKVDRIFGKDGIVKALGLTPETLSTLSMETLETLQSEMESLGEGGGQELKKLFDSIIEAGELEGKPEEIAKMVTALSNLDFNDNSYLNLLKLKEILAGLDIDIDLSALDAVYQFLQNIMNDFRKGNTSGENSGQDESALANADAIFNNRKVLNSVSTEGTVDEATKSALISAGLNPKDFVSDGKDGYAYIGEKEDIDLAKKIANNAWFSEQSRIAAAKNDAEAIKAAGVSLDSKYTDGRELYRDLGLAGYNKPKSIQELQALQDIYPEEMGKITERMPLADFQKLIANNPDLIGNLLTGLGIDNAAFSQAIQSDWIQNQNKASILESILGYEPGQIASILESGDQDAIDKLLNTVNNFQKDAASGGINSENVQQYLAQMSSAQEILQTAQTNRVAGNGLWNENGILSQDVLSVLQALPATSERASVALDAVTAAAERYNEAKAANNDIAAEEAIADYDNAMRKYDLATAIDEVAAARGLDAEQVAYHTEQLINSMDASEVSQYSTKALADLGADLAEQKNAIDALNKSWQNLSATLNKNEMSEDKGKALQQLGKYLNQLTNSTITAGKSIGDLEFGYKKFLNQGGNMQKVLKGDRDEITKLARAMSGLEDQTLDSSSANKKYGKTYGDVFDAIDDVSEKLSDTNEEGLITPESFMGDSQAQQQNYDALKSMLYNMTVDTMRETGKSWEAAAADTAAATGYALVDGVEAPLTEGLGNGQVGIDSSVVASSSEDAGPTVGEPSTVWGVDYSCVPCGHGFYDHIPTAVSETIPGAETTPPKMDALEVHKLGDTPKGSPPGGGGGGGGKPKKVANKRKSQYVKRYKKVDYHRNNATQAKNSEEKKKDYLYGEKKIEQLEKINKLTEKEARITADRISESRKYLIEDRQNLIKYLNKYDYDAEFDTDGFLANYEQVWTDIYEQIAALYEDNELTNEEKELEEELNVMLEELEGALEDYENSLKELADDIEKYEESLYEMYDNKVEALEHKVQFKIELEEDDMAFLDFWIESLGDSLYNALEAIEAMGAKANHLFDGLEVYKQGIEDIYALSDDPFQSWATGSLNTDILTQDQVDMLRDNRDGLIDYAQQLVDLREEIKDKVIDTFDLWTERIDASRVSLQHYTAVIEHFKNIIDIVGQDSLGLNDAFMDKLEQNAINQSMDHIESNKAYYESLIEQQAKAQEELDAARARGDKSSEEHWEEVVRTTTEAMETAQDELLTSLEDTLTLIAEQFETSMQRAVDAFNDAIYSYGGLEGLSSDYSMAKEYSSLMAQDYQKIYELNKINRNINKTLSDSNIIAGKQKMVELQKEINALQASNVELSQYDLEYLQAKYELRLAEIELENARNNKDTVRLSKDSEGNWSYVYTQNMDAIDEAQQKYEDALYNMQNLSYEYMEEMSSAMVDTSISMMEELQNLRIQDFDSYEEYAKEVQRIQDKYGDYLSNQENELNKSVSNNKDLYNQDWQNYSEMTGYKISESQLWADNFSESTLGVLLNSDSMVSDFANNILSLSDIMINSLGSSALQYFGNVETVLNKYGTSIAGFGSTVNSTVTTMSTKSKSTSEDIKDMAQDMKDAFIEIADVVSDWQEEFSQKIDDMLTQISSLIQEINEAIRKSAELTSPSAPNDLIGTTEAIELLNKAAPEGYDLGEFSQGQNGQIIANGTTYQNWLDYNASLVEEIDKKIAEMASEHTGTDRRKELEKELAILFVKYHAFKDIVGRIYDAASGSTVQLEAPAYSSFDTGGYTGEWGNSGKLAMLHEKELILNKQDTENFLNALNISRDLINSMIEMNARASSMGFGNLAPTSFQENSQTLEQQVTITAEFPNATNHDEIEEAFNNLINTASQYANRYNL